MDFTYSVHPEENLIRARVYGEVTVDGMIDLTLRAGRDTTFRPGMNVIVDLRESSGSWDYSEIQRYRDFIVHIAREHKRRWATVVRPGDLAGVARMVIVISEPIRQFVELQLFDDPETALQWVRGEIGALAGSA